MKVANPLAKNVLAPLGYDTDYEVSKVQIFIDNFKDRQLQKLEKKSNKKIKEKENKI